jgi:DNA-binding MarR family transcriptional regulator
MKKPTTWQLWTLHFETATSVLAEVEDEIRAHGLQTKELFLLEKLDDHPYPAELARVLLMPKPSVTFLVKRLERAGFVKRELDPQDLRRFRLTLTAAGRAALDNARAALEAGFGRRLARLSPPERAELARLLTAMQRDE